MYTCVCRRKALFVGMCYVLCVRAGQCHASPPPPQMWKRQWMDPASHFFTCLEDLQAQIAGVAGGLEVFVGVAPAQRLLLRAETDLCVRLCGRWGGGLGE